MYTIHATSKLRDRVKAPLADPVTEPTTALGNWYATALFWKPQVALFVNKATLLPALLPLAPAKSLADRFPEHLEAVLNALGTDPRFVAAEIAATTNAQWAKHREPQRRGDDERVHLPRRGRSCPRAQRGHDLDVGPARRDSVQSALQAAHPSRP